MRKVLFSFWLFKNWSILAFQCYVSFCYTMRWISCMYAYIPSLLDFPPIPASHHSRPLQSTELSSLFCKVLAAEYLPMIPKSRTAGSTHTHTHTHTRTGKIHIFFKLFTFRSKPSSVLYFLGTVPLCVYMDVGTVTCMYSSQQSYEVGTVTIPVC